MRRLHRRGCGLRPQGRLIPCTFVGKHLRLSDDDIEEIVKAGARQPVTSRDRGPGRRTV
jgi:hypothetical protein